MKNFLFLILAGAFCLGGAGCGDGDDDESPSPTGVVATTTANGATQTNVVATNDQVDAAAPTDEPATSPLFFSGWYTGRYENENGSSGFSCDLQRNGEVITGEFTLSGGESGAVGGTLAGFSFSMKLSVDGSGKWIRMEGLVSETGSTFRGTWTDSLGNSGTCWMSKSK